MRDAFFGSYGRSPTWWLCLILILSSALVFEFGVSSLRAAFFTTEEDVFQALEKNPAVKRRFEEAAAEELQQGWDRKTNKERDGEERVRKVVKELERKEEERREEVVRELLRNRVDGVEWDADVQRRASALGLEGEEVDRILSRGYGRVRGDEMGRT